MQMQSSQETPTGGRGAVAPLRWWAWWPVLLGPAAIGLTYLAYWRDWTWFLNKWHHEVLAVCLLAVTALAFLTRAWRGRNPAHIILTGLAVAFLCREIHFAGTNLGVYIALVLLGAWAWHWRVRLLAASKVGHFRPWLCAAGCTYVLAQLVARRVFRGLPLEEVLQYPGWLEEVVETMAHILLLITAFADLFGRQRAQPRDHQAESHH